MTQTIRRLSATLVAVLLLTAAVVLPAAAGTRVTGRPGGPDLIRPRSVLALTSNPGEKYDPYTARSVRLTCEPSGGTHPDPATACKQLLEVNGDFTKLNVNPGPCFFIYDPITVTAKGTWRGTPVSYEETFPNKCVLDRYTGAVFAF